MCLLILLRYKDPHQGTERNTQIYVIMYYSDVIMGAMASQITSIAIKTVYSGADLRKHQSSSSLAFVRGIHRWPVNSPHKGPVTRKMFPFDDVIMGALKNTPKTLAWIKPIQDQLISTRNVKIVHVYEFVTVSVHNCMAHKSLSDM